MQTLITPIFPFNNPARALLMTRVQNVLDRPNAIIEKNRPDRPIKRTGFRPMRSERRLQWRTVSASVAKKRD
jgi:hypothetical protein